MLLSYVIPLFDRVLKEMVDVRILANPLFAFCCLSQLIAFLVNCSPSFLYL